MAKAPVKKNPKPSKVSNAKKATPPKSSRAASTKSVQAAKAPNSKDVVAKPGNPAKNTRLARAPVISKDELRNQIEKLTKTNVTLKTKGRETAKTLRVAETRIEVLEHQISQIEAKALIDDKAPKKVRSPRVTKSKSEAESRPAIQNAADELREEETI